VKIPLLIQNDARDPNRAKDSWAINCFLEQDDFVRERQAHEENEIEDDKT
jgi:hypothetical protein